MCGSEENARGSGGFRGIAQRGRACFADDLGRPQIRASFQTLQLHASCCHLVFDRANDGREDCASNTAARDLSDQCADIDVVRWAGKNWNERSEYLSTHTTPDRTD